MTERLHIIPLETLSPEELMALGDQLDRMPEHVRQVIAGFETGEFLSDTLVPAFSLTEDQQRGVARFLIDATLGAIPTGQAAPTLARTAGVSLETAVQVVKEIETQLLAPLDLTLSGIAAPAQEPELATTDEGREALYYATTDDLLADITPLDSAARMRFLNDAKRDNRVLVLQAMSQLKLGAGSDGKPLSFRQLIAAECAQFTVHDWEVLARVEPDVFEEPSVVKALERTPLGAMLLQRSAKERAQVLAQFLDLDPEVRRTMAGRTTARHLSDLEHRGTLPTTHTPAVARILFFIAIGRIPTSTISELLEKTGMTRQQAEEVARAIAPLTPPSLPEPPKAPDMPQRRVPNSASRNIIDLRSSSAQKNA